MIAVAACLILVAAVSTSRNIRSRTQDISMVPDSDESSLQKDIQSKSPFWDFSITAYAKELDVARTDDGSITFVDAGIGSDGYTGIMFNIQEMRFLTLKFQWIKENYIQHPLKTQQRMH